MHYGGKREKNSIPSAILVLWLCNSMHVALSGDKIVIFCYFLRGIKTLTLVVHYLGSGTNIRKILCTSCWGRVQPDGTCHCVCCHDTLDWLH